VLLTSHYLEEVEALASRVVVLGSGRVLADDTVAAVRGLVGVHRVSIAWIPLPRLAGVVSTSESDGRVHLLTGDPDQLVRELVSAEVPFRDLEVRPTTLEEAFLQLTAA
jgi:ABC-2 type transport system ATP-binding protein